MEATLPAPRVRFYTKPGCHLCDEARPVLTRVCEELEVPWQEVDIQTDPQLRSRFGEKIPVVHIDGREHAIWTVDEKRLREALSASG